MWVDLVNSRTTVVTYDGYESTNVRGNSVLVHIEVFVLSKCPF